MRRPEKPASPRLEPRAAALVSVSGSPPSIVLRCRVTHRSLLESWNLNESGAFSQRLALETLLWASSLRSYCFPKTASEDTHVVSSALETLPGLLNSVFATLRRGTAGPCVGRDRPPRLHFARVEVGQGRHVSIEVRWAGGSYGPHRHARWWRGVPEGAWAAFPAAGNGCPATDSASPSPRRPRGRRPPRLCSLRRYLPGSCLLAAISGDEQMFGANNKPRHVSDARNEHRRGRAGRARDGALWSTEDGKPRPQLSRPLFSPGQ